MRETRALLIQQQLLLLLNELIINQKINLWTLSRVYTLFSHYVAASSKVLVLMYFFEFIKHFILSYFIVWFISETHDKSIRVITRKTYFYNKSLLYMCTHSITHNLISRYCHKPITAYAVCLYITICRIERRIIHKFNTEICRTINTITDQVVIRTRIYVYMYAHVSEPGGPVPTQNVSTVI